SAIATARLASPWPMMKRSSSETISRGEKSVMWRVRWFVRRANSMALPAPALTPPAPSGLQGFDRDVAVGGDADVGGDVERAAHDGLGVERSVDQRAGGRERVVAAGADAADAGLGFEHVAGAGEHQRYLLVGDDHHGFEPPQVAVGAPVLGKLNRCASKLTRILLELRFKALEQGEGVRGGAREPADDVPLAESPHLLGVRLHDGLADRDLAVAADRYGSTFANGEDGGAVPGRQLRRLHWEISLFRQDVGPETTGRNSQPPEREFMMWRQTDLGMWGDRRSGRIIHVEFLEGNDRGPGRDAGPVRAAVAEEHDGCGAGAQPHPASHQFGQHQRGAGLDGPLHRGGRGLGPAVRRL